MEHIFKVEEYPNLLTTIKLTAREIAEQIKPYHLTFIQVRNNVVEWRIQLPMFVPSFYDYVIQKERIPEQEEFYLHYLEVNKQFFDASNFDGVIHEGIKARAYRTYPSLVRDICFNKYVSEHLPDCNVIYNMDLDIKEGIDLLICKASVFYAVSLYTNTRRAYVGREAKVHRHTLFANVKYVEFPVDFKGSLKWGDFFMYGKQEFDNLLKVLV